MEEQIAQMFQMFKSFLPLLSDMARSQEAKECVLAVSALQADAYDYLIKRGLPPSTAERFVLSAKLAAAEKFEERNK